MIERKIKGAKIMSNIKIYLEKSRAEGSKSSQTAPISK